MAKQMEMFDDGGLMDEGGTVDPVSGNDVPPGSTQEEVRDDIPAQLSEGEFVFPADVVRFIGLEKLMKIRQRAKAGLKRMEDMGQMGNSEEAIMPDDLPFSIEDLDMEDDGLEMAQGGVVQAANGTFVQPTPTTPNAGVFYNPAAQSTTGVAAAPMQAASSGISQAATPVQAASAGQPTMFTNYQLPQAPVPVTTPPDQLPKFLGEVQPGLSGTDYTEEVYVNESGQTVTFRRYKDGTLKDAQGNEAVIPEGYTLKTEADKKVTTDPTKVKSATVPADENGGMGDEGIYATGTTMSFGGEKDPNTGRVINTVRGKVSYRGKNYYSGFMGNLKDARDMLQRSLVSGVHQISGGRFGTPMTLQKGESLIIQDLMQSRPGVNNSFSLGGVGLELDSDFYNTHVSGKGVTDRGKVAEVARYVSDRYGLGKKDGTIKSIPRIDPKTGKVTMVEIPTSSRLGKGSILNASQVLDQIELEKSRDERKEKVQAAQQFAVGSDERNKAFDDIIASAVAEAEADQRAEEARDSGDTSGYGEGGQEASDFGGQQNEGSASDPSPGGGMANEADVGYGSGTDCLTEDMKVKLNGVIDFVTNIKVGDMIDSYRVKEVLHKHMRNGYYAINNELKISNDHPVLANGTWTRPEDLSVGDTINGIPVVSLEYVEQLTPTVSIVIDGESFDVHTKNNIYTVHGRYREVRQKAA